MKTSDKLKACVEGYDPPPFFFREEFQGNVRLVAWTSRLDHLKSAFYRIIESFPETVEVLFKVKIDSPDDADEWHRYYGRIAHGTLESGIRANELCVFQDGGNQLCVRIPDTPEYIALDDHNILFVYSQRPSFRQALVESGLKEQANPLLFEKPHWHVMPKDSDIHRERFINAIGLNDEG